MDLKEAKERIKDLYKSNSETISIVNKGKSDVKTAYKKENEAIETILQELEHLQKENEKYSKQMDLDYVDENYISKDKIREKIEKLKEIADEDNMDEFIKISVLQDLLKEEKSVSTFEEEEERDENKDYEEFWKSIVENEDGTINKEQLKKELSDYLMIMDNCTRAYMLCSRGNISYPNTRFYEVESIFYDKFIDKEYAAEDLLECINEDMTFEEIVTEIKKYFE